VFCRTIPDLQYGIERNTKLKDMEPIGNVLKTIGKCETRTAKEKSLRFNER